MSQIHFTHFITCHRYTSHTSLNVADALHTLHYMSQMHFTHFIICRRCTSRTSLYATDALHTLHYMSQMHFTHFIICRRCTSHTSLYVTDALHTLHYMSQMHFTHFIICRRCTSHTSLPVSLHNFIITKLISTFISVWNTSIFLLFSSFSLVALGKIETLYTCREIALTVQVSYSLFLKLMKLLWE